MPETNGHPRTAEEWNAHHERERERLTKSGMNAGGLTTPIGHTPPRSPVFAVGRSYGDGIYRRGNGISG